MSFKFENDAKVDEKLDNKLKEEDLDETSKSIRDLENIVSEISSSLTYGEEKESRFSDNQSSFNSKLVWYCII